MSFLFSWCINNLWAFFNTYCVEHSISFDISQWEVFEFISGEITGYNWLFWSILSWWFSFSHVLECKWAFSLEIVSTVTALISMTTLVAIRIEWCEQSSRISFSQCKETATNHSNQEAKEYQAANHVCACPFPLDSLISLLQLIFFRLSFVNISLSWHS